MVAPAYFDSSAIVKLYDPREGGAERVRALGRKHMSYSSGLLYVEVVSAFARKRRVGDVDSAGLDRALRAFRRDYQRMTILDITPDVLLEGERILLRHPVSAPDAIHLASAWALRTRGPRPPFVTADVRLATAAQAEAFEVVLVR